jgi:hypothetical protein
MLAPPQQAITILVLWRVTLLPVPRATGYLDDHSDAMTIHDCTTVGSEDFATSAGATESSANLLLGGSR